eukprot:CAMPEP_0117462768 /NCGR_PEP_ID=MMETSP0784-20121206/3227_1 /TAXON_ID=39447 /ORGANISM="" /LENGTH=449 /DNA_ID=CAMNT_0005256549 /DNA_START=67 /DNA_END=1414 /DNA_ORIENTATION=-
MACRAVVKIITLGHCPTAHVFRAEASVQTIETIASETGRADAVDAPCVDLDMGLRKPRPEIAVIVERRGKGVEQQLAAFDAYANARKKGADDATSNKLAALEQKMGMMTNMLKVTFKDTDFVHEIPRELHRQFMMFIYKRLWCKSSIPGAHVTDSMLADWAYQYDIVATKELAIAQRQAALAERMMMEASAARLQAEAAMYQARLVARSKFDDANSDVRQFYTYCDRLRRWYNDLNGSNFEWLRNDPSMTQLRKFCAGLEYEAGREVSAQPSATSLQKSGLSMYDDPPRELCLEADCQQAWGAEVPQFHAPKMTLSAEDFANLGLKRKGQQKPETPKPIAPPLKDPIHRTPLPPLARLNVKEVVGFYESRPELDGPTARWKTLPLARFVENFDHKSLELKGCSAQARRARRNMHKTSSTSYLGCPDCAAQARAAELRLPGAMAARTGGL